MRIICIFYNLDYSRAKIDDLKMKITGIILAGGNSSRMGMEKALIVYEGQNLIERATSLLQHYCDSILISSNKTCANDFGCELVQDEHEDIGPISGLYAALKASQNEHNIVIPCDTPFVTIDVYQQLLRHSENHDAVIAGTADNFVEPLIGYYHRSIFKTLGRQIEKGDYKLHNILKLINAKVEIFSDKNLFMNINTPSDLASWQSLPQEAQG